MPPTTNADIKHLIEDKVVAKLVELTLQVATINGRVTVVEGSQATLVISQSAQDIDIARLQERAKDTASHVQTTARRMFDVAGKISGLVAMVGVLMMLLKGG